MHAPSDLCDTSVELDEHASQTCAARNALPHQRSYLSPCACESSIGPITAAAMLPGPDTTAANFFHSYGTMKWYGELSCMDPASFIQMHVETQRGLRCPAVLHWLMSTASPECVTHCQQLMWVYRSVHILCWLDLPGFDNMPVNSMVCYIGRLMTGAVLEGCAYLALVYSQLLRSFSDKVALCPSIELLCC